MGSMNVGKVSFGNSVQTATGTTQTAAQQTTTKKADKNDTIVIGGKEFTKKQVAVGGAAILASVAAIGTGIASYMRGKTAGIEGFTARIKEGFHTIVNKEARAEYAERYGKKAQTAAEAAANNKATEGAEDLVKATEGAEDLVKATEGAEDLVKATEGAEDLVKATEGAEA